MLIISYKYKNSVVLIKIIIKCFNNNYVLSSKGVFCMSCNVDSLISNIQDNREVLLEKFHIGKIMLSTLDEEYKSILNENKIIVVGAMGQYIIMEKISESEGMMDVLFYVEDMDCFHDVARRLNLDEMLF